MFPTYLTFTPGSAGCVPDATHLCLAGGRFRVEVSWSTGTGSIGDGSATGLTSESGYFWFFAASNVELVVKVLDACSFNQRFWVYAAGLTDVAVTLTVTDLRTGAVRTYHNPQGVRFLPIQDADAFATCP